MNARQYQKAVSQGAVIHLLGDVEEKMIQSFREQLEKVSKNEGEIIITLRSSGGNKIETLSLIGEIQILARARIVWIVASGRIASMAVYIFCAVAKSHRLAFANTEIYCHRGILISEQKVSGFVEIHAYRVKEAKARHRNFIEQEKSFVKLVSQATGMKPKAVRDLLQNPRYLLPPEAKKLGFMDHVLK